MHCNRSEAIDKIMTDTPGSGGNTHARNNQIRWIASFVTQRRTASQGTTTPTDSALESESRRPSSAGQLKRLACQTCIVFKILGEEIQRVFICFNSLMTLFGLDCYQICQDSKKKRGNPNKGETYPICLPHSSSAPQPTDKVLLLRRREEPSYAILQAHPPSTVAMRHICI